MAPPLFAAAETSSVHAVAWLLKSGADPNILCFAEDYSISPLWIAAENGSVRMAKLLLDNGANVDAVKSSTGNSPLFIAVQNNHSAMVSLLLSFGADSNMKGALTPLSTAIARGNLRLMAQLLNAGSNLTGEDRQYYDQIQISKCSMIGKSLCKESLEQMTDLISMGPVLQRNPSYTEARCAEMAGKFGQALDILRSLNYECPCAQIKFDMDRVIEAIYGVKGSDNTISVWENVPLMTQTEPTSYQDYAWTQVGRKIYRHGGQDNSDEIEERDELWELDVDTRSWKQLKTGGKSPGKRHGHVMWSWKNSLYIWGGRTGWSKRYDAKLYRLVLNETALMWEVIKTVAGPQGREFHAGFLYKDKYYITGGSQGDLLKEAWVLNMSTCKWATLKDMPVERYNHGTWAVNDKLYVLGGRRMHPELLESDTLFQDASYSIESFISYDLKTKMWSDEPVIGDRPFDISEFTILPLYNNAGDSNASSVIIWGGYHEFDVKGPTKYGR
eukprot:scaffold54939_cov62-Cyclotella_meneghiniana.AAC.1